MKTKFDALKIKSQTKPTKIGQLTLIQKKQNQETAIPTEHCIYQFLQFSLPFAKVIENAHAVVYICHSFKSSVKSSNPVSSSPWTRPF